MSSRPGHVIVLGLVGGVAVGKSALPSELERLGADRIDADAVAHEVLGIPEIVETLAKRFGREILGPDGRIDRPALGRVVFADEKGLAFLESTVHPRVRRRLERRLSAVAPGSIVVLDAPLLVENGLDAICDVVVMIEAGAANRERRAVEYRKWRTGEVARRERHQVSLEAKRRRADVTIENDGSLEDLRREVETLWKRLRARPGPGREPTEA